MFLSNLFSESKNWHWKSVKGLVYFQTNLIYCRLPSIYLLLWNIKAEQLPVYLVSGCDTKVLVGQLRDNLYFASYEHDCKKKSFSQGFVPSNGKKVNHEKDLLKEEKPLLHVAVKRSSYFHHYIIVFKTNESIDIVQYTGTPFTFSTGKTIGKVMRETGKISDLTEDIKEGMYIIQTEYHPRTGQQYDEARNRMKKRMGERFYHVLYSNCEHFANYVMTGIAYCEQVAVATMLGKLTGATVDCLACNGKSNYIKAFLSGAVTGVVSGFVMQRAAEGVIKTFSKGLPKCLPKCVSGFQKAGITICKTAARMENCKPSKFLKSTNCTKVARQAGTNVLKQTAKATFKTSAVVEGVFAAADIYKLYQQKEEKAITDRAFAVETTKTVIGAAASVGCTTAGAVLGQLVCPIPGLGAAAGSMLGSVFGKLVASSIAACAGY